MDEVEDLFLANYRAVGEPAEDALGGVLGGVGEDPFEDLAGDLADGHLEVADFIDHDVLDLAGLLVADCGVVGDEGEEDVHGGDADLEVAVVGEVQHALHQLLRNF